MEISTVLFDLDGTITDSGSGIINSVKYALKKAGRKIPPEDELRKFIGPPLQEQFMKCCGIEEKEAAEMVVLYREYYQEEGIFDNRVYDGVMEMLKTLKEAGLTIVMATSKPEKFAKMIAEHFGFAKYSDRWSLHGWSKNKKAGSDPICPGTVQRKRPGENQNGGRPVL